MIDPAAEIEAVKARWSLLKRHLNQGANQSRGQTGIEDNRGNRQTVIASGKG